MLMGNRSSLSEARYHALVLPCLSPGLYWNLHIEQSVDGYVYLFPTVFNFSDKEYELTLLPSTNFVLDVR